MNLAALVTFMATAVDAMVPSIVLKLTTPLRL